MHEPDILFCKWATGFWCCLGKLMKQYTWTRWESGDWDCFSGFANNPLCDFGQSTSQLCASASLLLIYRWILWGRSYPLSFCTWLWFPFWALCIKNKYSHIKHFIEQGWKLFIFDGGEPTDSGCEPAPAILALAPVSEPFQ